MNTGLMIYDNSKRTLAEKVKAAIERHDIKFSHNANLCLVNAGQFEQVEIPGVEVVGRINVLVNHLWVGVKSETKTT